MLYTIFAIVRFCQAVNAGETLNASREANTRGNGLVFMCKLPSMSCFYGIMSL